MDTYLYLILGIATTAGIGFSITTRGILYASPDTDNELMAYAAAQSSKWRRPSDVHKYGLGKTSMKEAAIIILALFQRLMRDKKSDHPYVTLTGFSVSVSAILIYLIGANYWGPSAGIFISLLYLFSFWPWEISLYGGHINIAGTFFLISIFLIQKSTLSLSPNFYLALSGISLCWAMFSSASSMRFLIPFWGAVFYSRYYSIINQYDYATLYSISPLESLGKYDLVILAGIALAATIAFSFYKGFVENMYYNKGPRFLRGLIESRDKFTLEHYLKHAKKKIKFYLKVAGWVIGTVMVILNTVNISYSWPIFIGFAGMLTIFTFPDVKGGIQRYFLYPLQAQRKTHFGLYIEYFAKKGITVHRNTRGGGWPWIPKIFWRFIPIHTTIFFLALSYILVRHLSHGQSHILPADIAILIISTAPIWWGEFTKAPQLSRSYHPALIISLLLIGYALFVATDNPIVIPFIFIATPLIFSWNLWIFLSDVYPARMGPFNLVKTLNRLGINEFYTYRTHYNKAFIEAIPGIGEPEYLPPTKIDPPYVVHYIDSINDVKDGWIIIPGTSSKAANMESEAEGVRDGDYTKDPALNKLIESKDIEKVATARIKTYGTSKIWTHHSEVASYRDLILHELGPKDYYRGYAWLLHSSKINNIN